MESLSIWSHSGDIETIELEKQDSG